MSRRAGPSCPKKCRVSTTINAGLCRNPGVWVAWEALQMAWRETLLRHFGPGLLGGITVGDWVKLLRDNHFAVAPSRLPRAIAITLHGLQNSIFRYYENWRYSPMLHDVAIPPPLFLLGHWRQGRPICTIS